MTAVYLSPSIAGMFRSSANLTLRELGSKNQAQAMIPFAGLAPSWTFRLTLPHRHSISSYSTTVPPNPSPLGTCHHSFPNHTQLPPILIHHTFFLRFFVSTPRLRLTMKDNTTKGISPILRWGLQFQLQISCPQETTQLEHPSSQPSYQVAGPVR